MLQKLLKFLLFWRKPKKIKIHFATPRTERRANKRFIDKAITNSFARKYSKYV